MKHMKARLFLQAIPIHYFCVGMKLHIRKISDFVPHKGMITWSYEVIGECDPDLCERGIELPEIVASKLEEILQTGKTTDGPIATLEEPC